MTAIIMVPTPFINVLCTKHICLAPGCRSFNSAKIKFHAFVPDAAWMCSCLTPSVLHLVSYSAVHINCLSFSCLLINSTLPETHLLLPPTHSHSCYSYDNTASQVHLWANQQSHPANTSWCLKEFPLHN